MKKSSIVWLVIIIIILIAGIWYFSTGSSSNTTSVGANTPSSTASTSAGADIAHIIVLETASTTKLGTVLVAMNGMTLYQYTKDAPGVSNCTGQCAAIWPPYAVSASEASSSLLVIWARTARSAQSRAPTAHIRLPTTACRSIFTAKM